jgi:non-ribosomal peptide synthase protein (TIGR01720 family)
MIGHGRDEAISAEVEPLSTVGFFISYTPLVVRRPDSGSASSIPSVRDQVRTVLRQGMDFDLLRFMTSDAEVRAAFARLPKAQVLFNHHGRRDEPDEVPRSPMFAYAPGAIGPTHSPGGLRYYPIAVSSEVGLGRLRFSFVYSANLHERASIATLVDLFRERLAASVAQAIA